MKRYEQAVRTITTFFAALLGFGLKTLLDEASKHESIMPAGTLWPCFFASTLLFLRYLVGSNNHMWREYVFPDRDASASKVFQGSKAFEASPWGLTRDFAFLTVFGFAGILICYSKSLGSFLGWNIALLCFALGWGLFGIFYSSYKQSSLTQQQREAVARWRFWICINLAQLAIVVVVFFLRHCLATLNITSLCWAGVPAVNGMWLLPFLYVFCLLWDLWRQFKVLQSAAD